MLIHFLIYFVGLLFGGLVIYEFIYCLTLIKEPLWFIFLFRQPFFLLDLKLRTVIIFRTILLILAIIALFFAVKSTYIEFKTINDCIKANELLLVTLRNS